MQNNCGSGCTPEGITTGVTPALVMPAAAWALIPPPPTAPTCSGSSGTVTPTSDLSGGNLTVPASGSATISGGTYSAILLNGSSTLTFNPGNYCITGSLNLNAGSDTLQSTGSGPVNLVINGNNIQLGSSDSANFSDLEIWSTSGYLDVGASGTLTANTFRFYSLSSTSGSGYILVDASGTLKSTNAYIYLYSGKLQLNASATVTLDAPTSGSYAGLVIYMPWSSNTAPLILDASSGLNVIGTILAPNCPVTINASGSSNINSQIIASNFMIDASSVLNVTFNAGQNYGTPTTALVELIK